MARLKQITAIIVAWYLSFWTQITGYPSESYAVAVATYMKDNRLREYIPVIWDKKLSQSYAKSLIKNFYPDWGKGEYKALAKLWGKESAWNPQAKNPKSSAFGIPQLLNLPDTTPAPLQIERGLVYIQHRYGKPSVAWNHWREKKWY